MVTTNRILEFAALPDALVTGKSRKLTGRVAIISGASHGIGRCVALHFAQHGAAIVVNYRRSPHEAETVTETIRSFGADVLPICADISDEQTTQKMVDEVIEEFGRVDILVNNAGVNRDTVFHRMTSKHWNDVLKTSLTGAFHLTRAIINPMRQRGYGRIINIGSVAGQCGFVGQANCAAAKAAIFGLTKSLALENAGHGITVNAVAPGFIETRGTRDLDPETRDRIIESIPLHRLGRPEEVAHLVGFLASEEAEYITGQIIGINGGLYM